MNDTARAIGPEEWLEGTNVRLRLVTLADCKQRYVDWLQDPEVNRYLETRFVPQTIETVTSFVRGISVSPHSYLFAIVDRETSLHVGNATLGHINPFHLFADVSYFVGDRNAWGRGLATDAVRVVTRFGFERLGLHRIQAGFYETNIASRKVLEKAGFRYEQTLRKKLRQSESSSWEDHVYVGALRDEWLAEQAISSR